jgi:hypothetical protein
MLSSKEPEKPDPQSFPAKAKDTTLGSMEGEDSHDRTEVRAYVFYPDDLSASTRQVDTERYASLDSPEDTCATTDFKAFGRVFRYQRESEPRPDYLDLCDENFNRICECT